MKFRIIVRAIIPHEGKILLVKNKNLPDFWCLPGGKLKKGEELKAGLTREIMEETGIESVVSRLLFIQQIRKEDQYKYPEFFFLVSNGNDYVDVDMSKASHALEELEAVEFKKVSEVAILPKFLKVKIPLLYENNFAAPIEFIG